MFSPLSLTSDLEKVRALDISDQPDLVSFINTSKSFLAFLALIDIAFDSKIYLFLP